MALKGLRVIEMAGLAPVPYCGQVLADYGAKVIRIDRAGSGFNIDQQSRGKSSIAINMKSDQGAAVVRRLTDTADVFLDPFRPGVMERLNVGVLCSSNPSLIYARLSGFGQSGPLSPLPGHDINYISQSGVLSALVDSTGRPTPPINLVADFAGGGLMLSNGILAALVERSTSGKGQVLDLSMSEGAAYASSFLWQMKPMLFGDEPGKNPLDGGAPFYGCYETKDGRYMALGAIEPQFYAAFVKLAGLEDKLDLSKQQDQSTHGEMRAVFESTFKSKTMSEWTAIFEGSEACCTPVLTFDEAESDAHNVARGVFFESDNGSVVPSSTPKFSRSGNVQLTERPDVGGQTRELLEELDFSNNEIDELIDNGTVSE